MKSIFIPTWLKVKKKPKKEVDVISQLVKLIKLYTAILITLGLFAGLAYVLMFVFHI